MEEKTYTRKQLLRILKKWNKESKETFSFADIHGLDTWFKKKIK
jgi:hypothetical protein